MKLLYKTKSYLADNSGETIVEVLVAFTVLSILLVLFAEGITFATTSEANARKRREASDNAMIELQEKVSNGEYRRKIRVNNVSSNVLYRCEYEITVDGNTYTYYVYTTS